MEGHVHDAQRSGPGGVIVDTPAGTMPALKGALHTHTTCSDGELTPLEVLRVYRGLGFDFIALTDHDFLMKPGAYEDVPDEFDGLLVFKGVEKTVFARGYYHVNEIAGSHETLHIFNHPGEYGSTVDRIIERIDEINGIVPLHAVEVTVKGYYTPEFDIDRIPFPKVASDDSHTRDGCGRAWIELTCEKDRDSIIRAIKNGHARLCYQWIAGQSAWGNDRMSARG